MENNEGILEVTNENEVATTDGRVTSDGGSLISMLIGAGLTLAGIAGVKFVRKAIKKRKADTGEYNDDVVAEYDDVTYVDEESDKKDIKKEKSK